MFPTCPAAVTAVRSALLTVQIQGDEWAWEAACAAYSAFNRVLEVVVPDVVYPDTDDCCPGCDSCDGWDWMAAAEERDAEWRAEREAEAAREAETTAMLFPVAIAAGFLDWDLTDRVARGIRA